MPTQKIVTAYTFDELSEQAKNKAREWMRRCVGETTDWADPIEEDAGNVGLKLTEWGIDRAQVAEVECADIPAAVTRILTEHGKEAATTYAAAEWRKETGSARRVREGGNKELAEQMEEAANATFIRAVGGAYLQMLRDEYAYRMSNEAIDEDILANDYLFSEEGTRTIIL